MLLQSAACFRRPSRSLPLVAGLLVCLVAAPSLQAQTLRREFWVPNSFVHGIAVTDSVVYIGGRFTHVAPVVGGAAVLDAGSGATLEPYLQVEGVVNAVAPDVNGGWYIGGAFTVVQGQPRHNLAQVDAAGSLTPWNPDASDPVFALLSTGATVYVGGDFFQVGGQFRSRIAALDPVTGAATSWNPNADGPVKTFAIAGNTIYVGGGFLAIGGQSRNNIAAIDASTGLATSWDPNADSAVEALALSGGTLYAGGFFTQIGAAPRAMLAALDPSTALASPWNPGANAGVLTLAVHELPTFPFTVTVYAGGQFTEAGGQPRSSLAALDAGTGVATSWNPDPNGVVHAVRIRTNRFGSITAIYAAGEFTTMAGQPRGRLASLDATGAVTSWNPNAGEAVNTLGLGAGIVFAGGAFTTIGGQSRNYVAALDAVTGRLMPWDPNADGPVWSLVASGGTVYAGGTFSSIGGQTRYSIAAIDAVTGTATGWNPGALPTTGGLLADVSAVAVHGGKVYLGGNFTIVGGEFRNRIAAVDQTTGSVTGWNPNANGHVRALAVHERDVFPFTVTIYAGGEFGSIGGQPRFSLAALDGTTGSATSWAPNPNSDVFSIAVEADEQPPFPVTVFAGGQFTAVGGQSRNHLAALDEGGAATPWNPDASGPVYALMATPGVVTAGGYIETIGGQSRTGVAALSASTGAALPWNLSVSSGSVLALGADPSSVYVGGGFQNALGLPYTNFAGLSGGGLLTGVSDTGVSDTGRPVGGAFETLGPNPTGGSTRLAFVLDRESTVAMRVYDVSGRLVRAQDVGSLQAGRHHTSWDGRVNSGAPAPAGVYFVSLRADGRGIGTRKLVMMR